MSNQWLYRRPQVHEEAYGGSTLFTMQREGAGNDLESLVFFPTKDERLQGNDMVKLTTTKQRVMVVLKVKSSRSSTTCREEAIVNDWSEVLS